MRIERGDVGQPFGKQRVEFRTQRPGRVFAFLRRDAAGNDIVAVDFGQPDGKRRRERFPPSGLRSEGVEIREHRPRGKFPGERADAVGRLAGPYQKGDAAVAKLPFRFAESAKQKVVLSPGRAEKRRSERKDDIERRAHLAGFRGRGQKPPVVERPLFPAHPVENRPLFSRFVVQVEASFVHFAAPPFRERFAGLPPFSPPRSYPVTRAIPICRSRRSPEGVSSPHRVVRLR